MSETMMKATGKTVVQVLSGPTRQMLRRSPGYRLAGVTQFSRDASCCRAAKLHDMEGFMVPSDRRQFQRLRLARPILSQLNGESALLLDIGVAGAFVEHRGRFEPGARLRLSFRWLGEDVEFLCEVARSKIVRPS